MVRFTYSHRFAAELDRVDAMLRDQEFEATRAQAMGSSVTEVDVDHEPDGSFAVSVRASVAAESIPAEARGFVGRELAIGYTEAWEPRSETERIGTFAVEILGAPGHVAGAISITAVEDGTELLALGEVTANVPLFGPMIEKAVHGAVTKAFHAQLVAADAWLAG